GHSGLAGGRIKVDTPPADVQPRPGARTGQGQPRPGSRHPIEGPFADALRAPDALWPGAEVRPNPGAAALRRGPMTSLKLAFRTLAKTPFVTGVAVLSLALGIGANAAIFSIFDQMLVQALPV